jgi:hypothetical protein
MNKLQLDRYARDAIAWRDWAKINYRASATLFASDNPFLYLPAATLAHHALEMYLKAALIWEGLVIFNPAKVASLDPAYGLTAVDCAWGHVLVDLAGQLSKRRTDFDLSAGMGLADSEVLIMPKTVRAALEMFDPFFSELRYPQELKEMKGVGQEEKLVLDLLVNLLIPFASKG